MVWTTQEHLPEKLRTAFEEILRPELITLVRSRLESDEALSRALINNFQEIQKANQESLVFKMTGYYDKLWSDIDTIKRQMGDSSITQRRIETALSCVNSQHKIESLSGSNSPICHDEKNCVPERQSLDSTNPRVETDQGLLQNTGRQNLSKESLNEM